MTKQELRHIKILSLDLLIEARISRLPVDLNAIAALYGLGHLIDRSKPRYYNAVNLSKQLLATFGYRSTLRNARHLGVRILAPMVILIALNIQSAEEISKLADLPYLPAEFRYNCYRDLISKRNIVATNMERKVLALFKKWLDSIR